MSRRRIPADTSFHALRFDRFCMDLLRKCTCRILQADICQLGMDQWKVNWRGSSFDYCKYQTNYIPFSHTQADICQLGMDQRNLTMLAQEYVTPQYQETDVYFISRAQADICQLGMDQRKVNMLAREYCDMCQPKRKLKPVILSHPMMPGLLQVRYRSGYLPCHRKHRCSGERTLPACFSDAPSCTPPVATRPAARRKQACCGGWTPPDCRATHSDQLAPAEVAAMRRHSRRPAHFDWHATEQHMVSTPGPGEDVEERPGVGHLHGGL